MSDGSYPWMAPECIREDGGPSYASDIWSFGMTILVRQVSLLDHWKYLPYLCLFNQELMTEELPYAELKVNSIALTQFILEGILPVRPGQDAIKIRVTDEMWGLLLKCWSTCPESRPSIHEVIQEIQALRYVLPTVVHLAIHSLNKTLSVEYRELWSEFAGHSEANLTIFI